MKKVFLLFSGLFLGYNAFAQFPVSTTPENKNALLEEFTGIYCTFCPDGHVRANNLSNTHGNNFWVMNIHVGNFAAPSAGDPDFRTPFGTAIANQSGLTGYPAGTINRRLFSGLSQGSGTAMSRTNWSNATNQALGQASPVNIAVDAEVDEQTRVLKVVVEYHYTANATNPTNKLNIALLQNNVEGPQTGASTYNPGNIQANGKYLHQHMLRHLLTGQWGADITNTTTGSTDRDTFTYTIPASLNSIAYDLANLEVIAFIAEGQQEVLNSFGADVRVVNQQYALDAGIVDIEQLATFCPGPASEAVSFRMRNNGATTITSAAIEYSVNGGAPSTYNWTGSLAYGQVTTVNLPTVNFTVQPTNSINVNVVSVNGGTTDNLTTNNTTATNFNEAATTTSSNVTLRIILDGYGSEVSWTLKNSANVTVAQGGPYTDGGSNNTFPVPDVNLTLANDCYTFQMNDSYGDGICCAYGNGNFQVLGGGVQIPGTTGSTFSSSIVRKFTVNSATSVTETADNNYRLYPNPASTEFNIEFASTVNEGSIRIMDIQGREIMQKNINNVDFQSMNIAQLENGFYMVVINADGKTKTEKLTVIR
jgi:hypothetical protein